MAVAITVSHRAQPGQRAAVHGVWESFMPTAVEENPGHLFYAYTLDDADGDVIRAFQIYRDEAAADAFLTHDAYQRYVATVEPLLQGPPEVTRGHLVWSKGMSHAR